MVFYEFSFSNFGWFMIITLLTEYSFGKSNKLDRLFYSCRLRMERVAFVDLQFCILLVILLNTFQS